MRIDRHACLCPSSTKADCRHQSRVGQCTICKSPTNCEFKSKKRIGKIDPEDKVFGWNEDDFKAMCA